MIWSGGRFSWVAILLVVFTTLAILLTDLAWRTLHLSASVIGAAGFALLLAGNGAILLAARSKHTIGRDG